MKRQIGIAAAFAVLAAAPVLAQEAATVEVRQSEEYGAYLTDANGRPLYLFTTDKPEGSDDAQITCTSEACLNAWPLFTTDGDPQAGEEADVSMLGAITHGDDQVVTYNGWPLYTFVKDEGAGAPQGQEVESFGGEWYLVRPSGEPVEK
jgi:predicted lipoprotein with Yx(FWY)xxD motif